MSEGVALPHQLVVRLGQQLISGSEVQAVDGEEAARRHPSGAPRRVVLPGESSTVGTHVAFVVPCLGKGGMK